MREAAHERGGRATELLKALANDDLCVSLHVACELFAGAELSREPAREREKVNRLLAGLPIAFPGEEFPRTYGRLLAMLSAAGRRIACMDLLIAAACIEARAKLVTRNSRDFARIPGLEIIDY